MGVIVAQLAEQLLLIPNLSRFKPTHHNMLLSCANKTKRNGKEATNGSLKRRKQPRFKYALGIGIPLHKIRDKIYLKLCNAKRTALKKSFTK